MNFTPRTDLAIERHTLSKLHHMEGIRRSRQTIHGITVHTMEITSQFAADSLCKPVGLYHTISMEKLLRRQEDGFVDCARCAADILNALLPKGNRWLIACLGNPQVTPDAIGPLCAKSIMVTRHLKSAMPETFQGFSEVSVICPGVLGTTGIESALLVKGAVEAVKPDAVIAIDALAAAELRRLCCTIQICNTGIEPGSGVGNRRYALNRDTLGVPVISLGVPTVVDADALIAAFAGDGNPYTARRNSPDQFFVTPREIDTLVAQSAKLLAYTINFALHEGLTSEDVDMFVG